MFLLSGIRFGAKMVSSGVRGEREGRAEPATLVSRATRDQSDPRSDRPARAAWAVQRLLAARW